MDKAYRTWRGVPGLDTSGDDDGDIIDIDTDTSDIEHRDTVGVTSPTYPRRRQGKGSAPRSVPGKAKGLDDGHDSDTGEMSSIVSSMMSASMCSSVAHTYGTEGGVAMSIGAESTLARSFPRNVSDRAQSGCSETSWEDDIHHDGHGRSESEAAVLRASTLSQQNLNRLQQLGPKLTHAASALGFREGDEHGAGGENGWPALPSRRPRQYSVGSAGSW